jgi:hypothetical protein
MGETIVESDGAPLPESQRTEHTVTMVVPDATVVGDAPPGVETGDDVRIDLWPPDRQLLAGEEDRWDEVLVGVQVDGIGETMIVSLRPDGSVAFVGRCAAPAYLGPYYEFLEDHLGEPSCATPAGCFVAIVADQDGPLAQALFAGSDADDE